MRKRDGHTMVTPKGDGDYYLAAFDEHDSILAQWQGAGMLVQFVGLYGEQWTLLRGQIEGVALVSADAYETATKDDQEMRRDEAIEG